MPCPKERLAQRQPGIYLQVDVANAAVRLCHCGCGRLFEACHGLPRRVRLARRRELDGLTEAHDVSALFPSVRPRDADFEGYAAREAAALDPGDPRVPVEAIEEGVGMLENGERRRIVDDWACSYADRWKSLCAAVGDVTLVGRAFVASAVRGAISERRPVPRALVAPFESGKLRRSPAAALGLVLGPPLVWDLDAAIHFCHAVGSPKALSPRKVDRALAQARECVGDDQVGRVRALTKRLRRELPIAGLPTASDTLSRGCELVTSDGPLASELAALLLVAYAHTHRRRPRLPRANV